MSVDLTDIKNWPDGAEVNINGRFIKWINGVEHYFLPRGESWRMSSIPWSISQYEIRAFDIKMRPIDKWKEGEERMNNIGRSNGNDGGHYEELDNLEKQPRYTDEDGLDWIDEFAANNSIDDFRAAMRFTIGKYERRLGKKDELSKELYKMSDYYQRWSKVEKELEK